MNDRFVVGLAEQEFTVQSAVAQFPLCQFRHGDDRETARQIPAELIFDRQAVSRSPWLGAIPEQVELNRQIVGTVFHQSVHAGCECFDQILHAGRKPAPLVLGNPVQTDCSGNCVEFESFGAEYLRQPAKPLPTEIVELKQAVLRHRVTKTEE